ncbi:MAG: ABC transporter substrate-binding protein [Alphaproteobacteria bacterium]|jgi:ABC-type amino acid transport substrate-binding protein|nr:ABC transporter substrate-binding protein [Alphaproteobacteria bacterium]
MKISKLLGVIFTALVFFTACEGKKDGSANTLTVGVSADYAPFEFFKDGEIVGFDIDLMKEIAKRLNKDVKFKDLSFDAILGSLSTDRLDAAISSIEPTEERRKSIDFSHEYIKSNRVLVCKGTSSIKEVDDLADGTVGVQSGSTHETYAKDNLSQNVQLKVKSLAKVPDLLQDMEIGNITCLILGIDEAEAILKSRENLKMVKVPGEVTGSAIAFPKASPLKDKVNKILEEMESDGSLKKLKDHWLTTK